MSVRGETLRSIIWYWLGHQWQRRQVFEAIGSALGDVKGAKRKGPRNVVSAAENPELFKSMMKRRGI